MRELSNLPNYQFPVSMSELRPSMQEMPAHLKICLARSTTCPWPVQLAALNDYLVASCLGALDFRLFIYFQFSYSNENKNGFSSSCSLLYFCPVLFFVVIVVSVLVVVVVYVIIVLINIVLVPLVLPSFTPPQLVDR